MKMAFKVNETCIGCQACFGVCPQQCIAMDGDKAKIDPAKCIECGACAGTCPMGAISQE